MPKNSVRVASGFSLFLSLSLSLSLRCSLIVFHIKYYWNLFLISLMSTIWVCVALLCLYNRRHGAKKKPKHIREENYFIYVHSMGSMNYLCTHLITSRRVQKISSFPFIFWKHFHQGFFRTREENVRF